MAVLAAGGGGLVPDIVFLIRGFRAFPTDHGIALRADEGCGACGEVETSGLAADDGDCRLATLRDAVAEGDVVVLYDKLDNQLLTVGVGHAERAERAYGVDVALLALAQAIMFVEVVAVIGEALKGQPLCPFADVCADAQGRGIEDGNIQRVCLRDGPLTLPSLFLAFHYYLFALHHQLTIAGGIGQATVSQRHIQVREAVGGKNSKLLLRKGCRRKDNK